MRIQFTPEERRLRKNKLNKIYRDKTKIDRIKRNKEAKEKDLQIKLKEVEKLFNYFKSQLNLDLLAKNKTQVLVKYRSLFNTLVVKKLKISQCHLIKFYKEKDRKFTSSDIAHSLRMFEDYKKSYPEVRELYIELYPSKENNKQKPTINVFDRPLTPIQKLVDNLTELQEIELMDLIKLRQKSWEWKSKDKITIYEGSY